MWNKQGTNHPTRVQSALGGKGSKVQTVSSRGRLLIISGPSGSGKTSICGELEKDPGVRKSISVTTRPPRPQEQEGRDYYFVSEEEFKKRIERGEFVEYASYSGHLYGTLLEPLEKAIKEGIIYLLEIDVQGAQQVLKKFPEAISIFILPPHEEELAMRIKGRNLQPDLQGRLAIAKEEIKFANKYRYQVVNDTLEKAVEEIRQILGLASSEG
ncbi:MAG TPA: guanylate kinase [Candidatus Tripitaka californicus]|uniref:guanylate kinase n=1 Tax=Candidatus Tripitaka californicus TaxID=3367616 RepID=UPI0040289776|nr:guanylate kinase [Planctomycetota bacterium]